MLEVLMQKLYYSIKEVSQILDEEAYILRYWEKEFRQLKPAKNKSGNRIYSSKDIALLFILKKLLREEKKSVKEAKEIVEETLQESSDWSAADFDSVVAVTQQKPEPKLEPAATENEPELQIVASLPLPQDKETDVITFLQGVLEMVKHL